MIILRLSKKTREEEIRNTFAVRIEKLRDFLFLQSFGEIAEIKMKWRQPNESKHFAIICFAAKETEKKVRFGQKNIVLYVYNDNCNRCLSTLGTTLVATTVW